MSSHQCGVKTLSLKRCSLCWLVIWVWQRIGPWGFEVLSAFKNLLLYFSGEKRIRKINVGGGGEKLSEKNGIKALEKRVLLWGAYEPLKLFQNSVPKEVCFLLGKQSIAFFIFFLLGENILWTHTDIKISSYIYVIRWSIKKIWAKAWRHFEI